MKKFLTLEGLVGFINFAARILGKGQSEKLFRFNHRIHELDFKKLHSTHSLLKRDLTHYLSSDQKSYSLITVNAEARPALTCNFNEVCILDLPTDLKPSDQIWLSFAVIEALPPEYSFVDSGCVAKISLESSIVNSKGEILYRGGFDVPLEFVNSIFLHRSGNGWLSWSISMMEVLKKISIPGEALKLHFLPKLMENEENGKILPAPANACCLGFPQVVHEKKRPKKIISISCESLTDPQVIRMVFPEESKRIDPHVFQFMEKYGAVKHSYAQGDSTLPASNAQLSGLFALQHGIGCYNPSPQAPNTPVRNEAILSPAQLLKEAGFLNFGSTRYLQLGPDYGCARGYDSYVNLDSVRYPVRVDLQSTIISPIEDTKNFDSYHYSPGSYRNNYGYRYYYIATSDYHVAAGYCASCTCFTCGVEITTCYIACG